MTVLLQLQVFRRTREVLHDYLELVDLHVDSVLMLLLFQQEIVDSFFEVAHRG